MTSNHGNAMLKLLLSLALLAVTTAATAEWAPSAPAPFSATVQVAETFRLAPGTKAARLIELGGVDPLDITAVREANSAQLDKRLQIGIGRPVPDQAAARSNSLRWEGVAGGVAAHWEISSTGASALRVEIEASNLPPSTEIRFAGSGDIGTVYGPYTPADVLSGAAGYWSPVLEGERAIIELFVGDAQSASVLSLAVSAVSHLFVSPADPNLDAIAKASQACEVDLICRSATDAALASLGKAVARMTFMDGLGGAGSFLCTGTLLTTTAGPGAPYFFSAAHCISTQASASTLTTHWFYDRTACGSGSTSASYVQVTGGATLLYADEPTDVLFLRLNQNPPAGAFFAGWDSTAVVASTATTAVHHPAGDWKKVSLGTIGGFSAYGGGSGDSHIIGLWNGTATGVTEGGSSGSGIFTAVGAPATDYRLRGGLHGGPSSCSASGTALRDYYSRFDRAYPVIAQYLNPVVPVALSVTKAGTGGGTVTSSPAGIDCGATCSANFNAGTSVTLTATASSGSVLAGWSGACSGTGTCQVAMDAAKSVTATFNVQSTAFTPNPTSLSFGGQSMNTTAPAQTLTLTNTSGSAVTVSSITASTHFGVTHNCATVNPSANCMASVTFTPTAEGALTGTITIASSAGTQAVPLTGTGEKSLVTHYYYSILRRAPEAGGKAFWESEAVRMQGRGVNINETWYAMAQFFFFSAEYTAFNRDNTGFVTDLYKTFFNRDPDAGGLAYWTGQLGMGMPREVVLAGFMFSPEFVGFTQAIFGNTAARAEVDMVVNFYRGLLARLPDDGGFANWVGLFRAAQCAGAQAGVQVYAQVESISGGFANSGEYTGKGRSNAQYVGDLYNAFLRRGGELAGVQSWINQLNAGSSRDTIRRAFISTGEFNARVNAIINQGCL